jgi:hypothetical protein
VADAVKYLLDDGGDWISGMVMNVSGALGSFLIIACYFLTQIDRMSSRSLRYSVLNGLGAALEQSRKR